MTISSIGGILSGIKKTLIPEKGSPFYDKVSKAVLLKKKIDRLNNELAPLRDEIALHLLQNGYDRCSIPRSGVVITLCQRHSWEYTPETELSLFLSKQKATFEQDQGIAKITNTSQYISIKSQGRTK